MPVIPYNVIMQIMDRAAAQYAIIADLVEVQLGGYTDGYFNLVTGNDDPDVETIVTDISKVLDQGFSAQDKMGVFSEFGELITQLEAHVTAMGYDDMDDYLYSQETLLDERASLWRFAVQGVHWKAKNVFKASQVVMGTLTTVDGDTFFTVGDVLQTDPDATPETNQFAGVACDLVLDSGSSPNETITVDYVAQGGNPNSVVLTLTATSTLGTVVATIHDAVVSITGKSGDISGDSVLKFKNQIPRTVTL